MKQRATGQSGVLVVVVLAGLARVVWAQPSLRFTVERMGLTGEGYENERGWSNSTWGSFRSIWPLTEADWYSGSTAAWSGEERRGSHAWIYDRSSRAAVRAGLYDDDHTRADGSQMSGVFRHISQDVLLGHSARAHRPSVFMGTSAWAFDLNTGQSTRAGLYDAEHQSGRVLHNEWRGVASSELAYGIAQRHNAQGTLSGESTWVYDTRTRQTTRVGLIGELYVSGGYAMSTVLQTTAGGHVLGVSSYLTGQWWNGRDTWLYDHASGVTRPLGLGAGTPRMPGDTRVSDNISMNEAGQVVGTTSGHVALPSVEAWRYDPRSGTTRVMGLRDEPYLSSTQGVIDVIGRLRPDGTVYGRTVRWRTDGAHDGDAWVDHPVTGTRGVTGLRRASDQGRPIARSDGIEQVYASGAAVGTTSRNGPAGWLSREAWVRDERGVREIGLRDPRLMHQDGFNEQVVRAYDDGAVVGSTFIRAGDQWVGNRLWLHDIASGRTHSMGLSGGRYTGSDGREEAHLVSRSSTGLCFGHASMFTGLAYSGRQAWVWNAATQKSTELGLSGPDYLHQGRTLGSQVQFVLESGVAVGTSERVNISSPTAAVSSGSVAWYFDPRTETVHDVLAGVPNVVRSSDNYASASAELLTSDGFLLGNYRQIDDEAGANGRLRTYLYRPDVGFHDVQSLIIGEGAQGVRTLYLSFSVHNGLELLAHGYMHGQSPEDGTSLFLLRPVPSPQVAGTLLFAGLHALGRRARRVNT